MNQATHLQRGWQLLPAIILSITFNSTAGESTNQMSVGDADALRAAVEKGTIAYRLTTPEELQKLLGKPLSRRKDRDGGTELLDLDYTNAWARFVRFIDPPSPYTLWSLKFKGQAVDMVRVRR